MYDDDYFINFLKKTLLRKWVKDSSICGMSVDLPGAASQVSDPFQQPADIACGRDFAVFVKVSFPLARPTDTLCPLVQILYETQPRNTKPQTIHP